MEKIDCVVIGAGVVGLAAARRLANAGREVLILEAAERIGTGISARNSEVLHAGLYYPEGSLKARLCLLGRELLHAYCEARAIPHRRCGKLVVASDQARCAELEAIAARARRNGVAGVEILSRAQARALEPELQCAAALHSPATGIVDSHALMLSLLGDAQAAGALLAVNSPVTGGTVTADGIVLTIGGGEPMELLAGSVINCAGLAAQALARSLCGLPAETVPPLHYAKGNYYALSGRAPFTRLIYPLPQPGGLGVHLTLDLAGGARFGPDVEWIETLDYRVDPTRADAFAAEIRRYWPALPEGALNPDYAGIRPKLHGPGQPAQDFAVHGPRRHGVTGLVCLYGIESPGLTASLALADFAVAALNSDV
ncbi:L-2-hydroxyglutarate oxidase LhgO [mine drainage metagenome]|uniref:L-2-hydroxyglutarate oxidase LhgO n=1 Tax=mine drainage metagenome TaxID=410659 RepID=A0A1J5RXQ3_9ZZZZ